MPMLKLGKDKPLQRVKFTVWYCSQIANLMDILYLTGFDSFLALTSWLGVWLRHKLPLPDVARGGEAAPP